MTGGGETVQDQNPGGFGVYLHWPYCESKCPYCDFNSQVGQSVDTQVWIDAIETEIHRYARQTAGRTLQTVYFGGGTPSLMHPDIVASAITAIRTAWRTVNDLEITLEANPGSVDASRFANYKAAGVNRVSLGVQALDDRALKQLGRRHDVKDALRALEIAKQTFDRVSFDLIYARQDQSLDDWRQELSCALTLAGDHLSLYQLTVEDGTAFAERAARGGLRGLPDEDLSAEMYELTQELCSDAGFPAYEISNHSREGSESRHNMIYWRGGEYVGIGPGAHGRISIEGKRYATEAFRSPAAWLDAVARSSSGECTRAELTHTEIAIEYLLMSLRTTEGMNLDRYEAISGSTINPTKIQNLTSLDLLQQSNGQLSATAKGRLVLNAILRDLSDS